VVKTASPGLRCSAASSWSTRVEGLTEVFRSSFDLRSEQKNDSESQREHKGNRIDARREFVQRRLVTKPTPQSSHLTKIHLLLVVCLLIDVKSTSDRIALGWTVPK
jgi:hypothetical protein